MLAKGRSADPSPSSGAAADTVSVSAPAADATSKKASGARRLSRLLLPYFIAHLHQFRVLLILIPDFFLQV